MTYWGLKSCPFCGGLPAMETFQTAGEKEPRYRVRCTRCWCETNWDFWSEQDVVKAWNTRAGGLTEEGPDR